MLGYVDCVLRFEQVTEVVDFVLDIFGTHELLIRDVVVVVLAQRSNHLFQSVRHQSEHLVDVALLVVGIFHLTLMFVHDVACQVVVTVAH